MSKLRFILLAAVVMGLTGCAFGRKVDYQNFQDAGKSALTQVLASPEIADALKH